MARASAMMSVYLFQKHLSHIQQIRVNSRLVVANAASPLRVARAATEDVHVVVVGVVVIVVVVVAVLKLVLGMRK